MRRRKFIRSGALLLPSTMAAIKSVANVLSIGDPASSGQDVVSTATTLASFSDNFTRADANPLSNPASGGTWTVGPGVANDLQIVSNTARAISSTASAIRVLTPEFSPNQKASVTCSQVGGWAACVRMNSTTDADCYIAYSNNSTQIILYRRTDNGSTWTVGAAMATYTVSTMTGGETISLKATGSNPTTLETFLNGVSLGTVTDSTSPLTTGQPGVHISSTGKNVTAFLGEDV